MRRTTRYIGTVAATVALLIGGAGVLWLLSYAMPMTETSYFLHLFFTLLLIALGLAIPYWMLKLVMHAAHIRNPREKEMVLSDIPKDKDQLAHSK